MQDLLNALKDFVPAVLTGLGGWFFGRARNKAEIEQINQQNKNSEFTRLKALGDEFQQQYHDAKAEIKDIKAEMRLMRQEQATERERYQTQIRQLEERYQAQIRQLEKEMGELRAENEKLRADLAVTQKNIAPATVPTVKI